MNKEIPNKYRIVIFILLAVVVFGLWFLSRSDVREIRNVVLISIDTCRADHLSCYGYKQKTTPNIDAIAAEGILFENVVAPVPMTLPSHASMLTGTIPIYHGIHDNLDYRLAESNITLPKILKDAGFTTGAAISSFVLDSQFGIDQGFESYDDRFKTPMGDNTVEQRRGNETTGLCLDWLDENKEKRVFFVLYYYDPHDKYEPPEPFASMFAPKLYAGEIAYTDHCIGRVIEKLKELDLYDSTLVIITSDHGEMLGEHGELIHTYFIYESAIKVPLVFKVPGWNKAVRIKQMAGLIDIVPTVCSLLDIEPPAAVQGVDVSTCFGGRECSANRGLYCESLQPTKYNANSLLGLVTDRFKYIQTTRPELYDLTIDPAESSNLIDQLPNRARILKDRLARIGQQSVRSGANGKADLDEETRLRLESLGYVGGSVVEQCDFKQTKTDPKDRIKIHVDLQASFVLAERGNYDKAITLCRRVIQKHPDIALAYESLGDTYRKLELYDKVIEKYQKALQIEPDNSEAHYNLGNALRNMGKSEQAIEHYQEALQLEPDDFEAHNHLGGLLGSLGKFEEAIDHYQQALQIKPDYAYTHYSLGIALEKIGKLTQAVEHYQQALKLEPDRARIHYNLAAVLLRQQKVPKAIVHWKEVLRLKPDHIESLNALAWVLSTVEDENLRDTAEAVRLAKRACDLTQYSQPNCLDTLAVAHAATGDFPKAIENSEKALRLAVDGKALTHKIQEHMDVYKTNKPYYNK